MTAAINGRGSGVNSAHTTLQWRTSRFYHPRTGDNREAMEDPRAFTKESSVGWAQPLMDERRIGVLTWV